MSIFLNFRTVLALDTIKFINTQSGAKISEQNIALIEKQLSDFEQAFNTASQAEKQELAQFMQKNPEMFDYSNFEYYTINDSLYNGTKSATEWDKLITQDSRRFVGLVVVTGITIYAVQASLMSANPLIAFGAGAALAVEFVMVLNQAEQTIKSSYKPFVLSLMSDDLKTTKSSLTFTNDEATQIKIEAEYRSLYNADKGQGTSSVVDDLADAMNTFLGYWNKAISYIPGMSGTVPTLEAQSTYVTNPDKSSVSTEYITIENISNENVTLDDFSNSNGTISVTFTTTESEDQEFTFDLVYTNPNFSIETTSISAKLTVEIIAASIEIYSGNNQTANIGETLTDPIEVLVKDANGDPFENAIVHFSVSEGSVSVEQATTDASGIATTNWTLGSTEGEQTLEASAFESDGTTALQGSPLTFTASSEAIEPYSIEIYSGNNQTGTGGNVLGNSIKVLVKDNNGNPCENATVYFSVNEGSVSATETTTGTDGLAFTEWTLGSTLTEQTLIATAFKPDGTTPLSGSPLTFTATNTEYISDVYTLGGYQVVDIGTQTWMVNNLAIPSGTYVESDDDWKNLEETDAAYCHGTYGYLYTWEAAKNACPAGWHLPTDAEWTTLTNYLGGYSVGGKMKETGTTHWTSPNYGATNKSHFSALPSGFRDYYYGSFRSVGIYGYWWSSTEGSSSHAYDRNLHYDWANVGRDLDSKSNGFSVRCLRD